MAKSTTKSVLIFMTILTVCISITAADLCAEYSDDRYGCTCRELATGEGVAINCSNTGIRSFPTRLPDSTVILDLRNNDLEKIELIDLMALTNLRTLMLDGNSLVCDCKLRWFYNVVTGTIQMFVNLRVTGAQCSQGSSLLPIPLEKKPVEEFICPDSSSYMQCYQCDGQLNIQDCLVPVYCSTASNNGVYTRQAVEYRCRSAIYQSRDGPMISKGCVQDFECADMANRSHCSNLIDQGLELDEECSYCCEGSLCNIFTPLDTVNPEPSPTTASPFTEGECRNFDSNDYQGCTCREASGGVEINCVDKRLRTMPARLPENTIILDLSNNIIVKLKITDLLALPQLQILKLDGNALMCDCDMKWLYHIVQRRVKRFETLTVLGAQCSTTDSGETIPMFETTGDHYICQDSFPMQCYTCDESYQLEGCLVPLPCETSFADQRSSSSSSDSAGDISPFDGYRCLTSMLWTDGRFVTSKSCLPVDECIGRANRSVCVDKLRDGQEEGYDCSYCCTGPLCNIYSPLDIRLDTNPGLRTVAPTEDNTLIPTEPWTWPCPADTISDEKGVYRWPRTEVNETAYLECEYGEKKDEFIASRKCSLVYDGQRDETTSGWEQPDLTHCKFERHVTNSLDGLADMNVTTENSMDVSMELYNLTMDADSFTENDVDLSVGVVENVLGTIGNQTDIVTARNLLGGVKNLLAVSRNVLISSQRNQKSSSRIIKTVDQLSQDVTFDGESITIDTESIAIGVTFVNRSTYSGIGWFVSSRGSASVQQERDGLGSENMEENVKSSIQLPPSILDDFPPDELARIQFVSYNSNKFFKAVDAVTTGVVPPTSSDGTIFLEGENKIIKDVVNSPIIASSVGRVPLNNLRDPVVITLTREAENSDNPDCVFWDFQSNDGLGGWSGDGCRVSETNTEEDNVTICECDHLTNFALLMDIYGSSGNIDAANQKALSIISYIGCGISLFGLALTIITYIIFSKLRKDNPAKILMHLCSALFIMLLIFLTGSFAIDFAPIVPWLCKAVAVLLHYFLLAVMCWTAVEAFNMYLLLVKVFKVYISRFVLKICIFGWGVPLIIVAITLGLNLDHYGYYNNICWLSRTPFYYSFLLPVGLILLFNSIIYGLVLYQLCGLNSKKLTSSQRYTAKAQLRAAIGLMVLLGLTWGLALFAINEASLVINYLFAIFNSLQGLFIFIFHCVMKTEVRKQWKKTFCCITGYESSATTSESTSAKKYKQSSDKAKLKTDPSNGAAREKRGYDNRTMDTSSQL